jgi:hypothetical protein
MNELEAMAQELKNPEEAFGLFERSKSRFDQKDLEAVLKELKQLEELYARSRSHDQVSQPSPRGIRQQP